MSTAVHNKFRWCKRHVNAVMHTIGQVEHSKQKFTVLDAAEFMNVSKPTARKYLMKMVDTGFLYVDYEDYRPNVKKATFKLANHDFTAQCMGYYENDYRLYCQRVLGVTLIDENL